VHIISAGILQRKNFGNRPKFASVMIKGKCIIC